MGHAISMKTISDVRSISKVTTDRILVHDTLGGSFSAHIFDNVFSLLSIFVSMWEVDV